MGRFGGKGSVAENSNIPKFQSYTRETRQRRVGSRSVRYRLIFVLKTAQNARHVLGGAFGGYANDRIAHLAQEAYPAQEPPAVCGGSVLPQARKSQRDPFLRAEMPSLRSPREN